MKVQVARASNRNREYTVNLNWAGHFADELLNINKDIPTDDEYNASWEMPEDEEFSYIVTVNKKTRTVEIMIYDYYVE